MILDPEEIVRVSRMESNIDFVRWYQEKMSLLMKKYPIRSILVDKVLGMDETLYYFTIGKKPKVVVTAEHYTESGGLGAILDLLEMDGRIDSDSGVLAIPAMNFFYTRGWEDTFRFREDPEYCTFKTTVNATANLVDELNIKNGLSIHNATSDTGDHFHLILSRENYSERKKLAWFMERELEKRGHVMATSDCHMGHGIMTDDDRDYLATYLENGVGFEACAGDPMKWYEMSKDGLEAFLTYFQVLKP